MSAWCCGRPARFRTWRTWAPGPRPRWSRWRRTWRTPSSACWAAAPAATRPWRRSCPRSSWTRTSTPRVIEARQLTKRFGDFVATDDVSFTVSKGEIFGLLGPNGAGKSTTFKMECGLLKPSAGQALVMGIDLKSSPSEARQRLGYMAQKFSLYAPAHRAEEPGVLLRHLWAGGRAAALKIQEMVEAFALEPFLDTLAGELPLGFKQRLALACAVMHEPQLIFLDEPTSGVDPVTRREFWTHINGLAQKGVTVMVTTHFMDEAEYCDRIGLVYRGKLIALGTPDELKQGVATPEQPNPTMEDAFIELVPEAEPMRSLNPRRAAGPCAGRSPTRSSATPAASWWPSSCR